MKHLLFFLLAFPFLASAQILEKQFVATVQHNGFTQINDSLYRGDLIEFRDVLIEGYQPSGVDSGFICLDGTGRAYRVEVVNSFDYSSLNVDLIELDDYDEIPIGVGIVAERYGSTYQIPNGLVNSIGISSVLQAKILNHNTKIAATTVQPPDTLYLQELSGTTAISNGDTIPLIDYVRVLDTPAMLLNYPSTAGYGIIDGGKTWRADTTSPNGLATRLFAKTLPTSIIADRLVRSNGSNLVAGNLSDNGTRLQALLPWQFQSWTTAGRPTGVLGYMGLNSTDNIPEWYNGTTWDQMHTPWTQSGTTTTIPFNLTSTRYITFTPDVAFTYGPLGFQYDNNNSFRFGMLNGARIQWQDAGGGGATLLGQWTFPANSSYPANVYLASSGAGSNDVRLVVTRSGTGASQHIYAYTQRYAVDNDAPSLITAATNHTWGTRRTTTSWNTTVDTSRMHLNQNGDLSIFAGAGYTWNTPQARLNVIGRGTASTYPLLLLENRVGTDRFSVLENGEVRVPILSATPTRIVGADADGDLGELSLSGLSITSGVLSAQSIYNLLPTGDVQIAAANNSLRLNSLDTMKMNHAIITTPGTTNLLLLNPNVGATGYPGSLGGGYHTVINGNMAVSNAGTGHIVIGGVVGEGGGYNFMTSVGYSSNIAGDYAIGIGYDADATNGQSMAIGYGARADELGEATIGSNNYAKLNLWTNTTSGQIVAVNYGTGTKEAADLSKTQSAYIAGFATDGTVLDLERKRDTTIYVADADYDFSAALTTAQISRRYNRVIFLMTTTAGASSDSELTLHTPDANLMQVEYLIRSTDETGGFTNVIQFGSNNAVASNNTLVGSYTPAAGQGVGLRAGLRSGVYKYFYY